MKQILFVVVLVTSLISCNSTEQSAKEKVVAPWEGPKSAARAAKNDVERSAQEVDKQLAEMDDESE